jgi:hypothetical protein
MYTTSGVVVRDDGSFTTDWFARGADPGLFNGGPSWVRASGQNWVYLTSALEVSANNLLVGSNTVQWSFTDDFNRALTGQTTVIRNSALHTALVKSAASILL